MHRFYLNLPLAENEIFILNKDESKHAINVLRLSIGSEIELLDGTNSYIANISQIDNGVVYVKTINRRDSVEAITNITLYQGFPKADKIYTIVQKCTEIGVRNIVPVIMKRSVKKPTNENKIIEKCNKIAIEASKQSGRNYIPQITKIIDFKSSLAELKKYDIIIVPWENSTNISLKDVIKDDIYGKNIAVLIGPEGGISNEEIQSLENIGAKIITLGKRILRTETAGECTCFAILSMLNDI